jgi:hypothetical protein
MLSKRTKGAITREQVTKIETRQLVLIWLYLLVLFTVLGIVARGHTVRIIYVFIALYVLLHLWSLGELEP